MGHNESSQSDWITPPRRGQITVLATGAATATQDLRLCGVQTADRDHLTPGLPEHFASFQAVGADAFVTFGVLAADVSGASDTATGVNAVTATVCIPVGTTLQVRLQKGVDNFVGYKTATGSGTLRIWQSSP